MIRHPTKKEIIDALTSDSSRDGCDPDWRRSILNGADPKEIERIQQELRRPNELPKETISRLKIEGKIR